jgi:hypothetical protein
MKKKKKNRPYNKSPRESTTSLAICAVLCCVCLFPSLPRTDILSRSTNTRTVTCNTPTAGLHTPPKGIRSLDKTTGRTSGPAETPLGAPYNHANQKQRTLLEHLEHIVKRNMDPEEGRGNHPSSHCINERNYLTIDQRAEGMRGMWNPPARLALKTKRLSAHSCLPPP